MTPTIVQAPPRGVGVPQSNVIPALGEMTLDVRSAPGVGEDEPHAELEELCRAGEAAVEGVKVEWEPVNAFRLATKVDKAEPLVQAMMAGVRRATGRAHGVGVPGSTDGTILRMELGAHRDVRAGNRQIPTRWTSTWTFSRWSMRRRFTRHRLSTISKDSGPRAAASSLARAFPSSRTGSA